MSGAAADLAGSGNKKIALLIGDADTLTRLRSAQRRYILDLFSGQVLRRFQCPHSHEATGDHQHIGAVAAEGLAVEAESGAERGHECVDSCGAHAP